jgi:hypothetical protein
MVMRDVMHKPSSIMNWSLSPAIYAFPDWIVAGFLQASPLPRTVLPVAYGGFLLAAFGACIGWILVEMRTARRAEAAFWGLMLIAGIFLASNATRIGFGGLFLKFVSAPYIHSGSIFSGLLFIPLLSQVFHGEGVAKRRATIAAVALTTIACYSDLIFSLWFAGPVSLAFLITRTRMHRLRKLQVMAGLATCGVIAAAIDRGLRRSAALGGATSFVSGWLRTSGGSAVGPKPDIERSIDVWQELLKQSGTEQQWQLWLPVILSFVMLGRGICLTCTSRDRRHARKDSLETALIFANTASLFLPLLAGIIRDPTLLRYSLPAIVLPYAWLLAFASRYHARLRPWLSAAAVGICLLVTAAIPSGFAAINRIENKETLSSLLVSLGQRAGYGDYWSCNRTMFETDYAVHCLPIDQKGGPLSIHYNSKWFERRADDGKEIQPTFVVMRGLDEIAIRRLFGEPNAIKHFRGDNIWLYDKPLPLIKPPAATATKRQTNILSGEFVGIGTATPDAALHVARNHPDLLTLQNLSTGGSSWVFQVGGNGWQNGNFMIVNRHTGRHSFVLEPQGRVLVMGDMHVSGKLTTSQLKDAPPKETNTAKTMAILHEKIDSLTATVEKLLGRVRELEDELEDAAVLVP